MVLLWALAALCLGVSHGEQVVDSDSLQGALDAINRRQRDLQDPTLYYVKHFHPTKDQSNRPILRGPADDYGQPEDIGYGYQKSLSPNTPGLFESIPLLENELGSSDTGVGSITNADKKELEDIILDYIAGIGHTSAAKHQESHYGHQKHSKNKKSVFRERDINIPPDTLQNLLPNKPKLNTNQYFENGENLQNIPSPFRERTSQKPLQGTNPQTLVKSFGGLNRDTDDFPENSDDSDEYLSMLNSVWEKYQDSNPDHLDPEDLSESHVEEIMGLLNPKQEIKKLYGGKYEHGNDFFNSPLAWVKRDGQLSDNAKLTSNQNLHASNLLNTRTRTFESIPEEERSNGEKDFDIARLVLGELKGSTNKKRYIKRFWRGNTNREYNIAKRFPVTKRSLSFYTSPAVIHHKHSGLDNFTHRRKKNIKSHISVAVTDPKVAQELNNIFSATDNMNKDGTFHNNTVKNLLDKEDSHNSTKATEPHSSFIVAQNTSQSFLIGSDHGQNRKTSGQKEESSVDSQHKQLGISKKSVDWSDYFGIDKRQKKSKTEDGDWLLHQYLKAYSISAKAIKNSEGENNPGYSHFEIDNKSAADDIDAKLRAMEDMIVDQAVKYTGAHEGMTDSEEIKTVKDRVIAQLAAAYSLEKMRKALSEFKTSINDQTAPESTNTATNIPDVDAAEKKNRGASKRDKAEISDKFDNTEKKEDNNIGVLRSVGPYRPSVSNQDESCPIINDIMQRCIEIANMAGDSSNALVPLCNLHQICYLCGPEMGAATSGCDVTFLAEGNGLCGDSPRCRYTVRRTLATIHSLRGDPSPFGCDWENHPCLARYIAMTMR